MFGSEGLWPTCSAAAEVHSLGLGTTFTYRMLGYEILGDLEIVTLAVYVVVRKTRGVGT